MIHGNLKQVGDSSKHTVFCEFLTMHVKQNILVDSAGHARLSDVGFAKLVPTRGSRFDWAEVGADGCRWAAPEIFQRGKLSEQSDVFSYGFVATEVCLPDLPYIIVTDLIQIFTGQLVWEDIDVTELRSKLIDGERPRIPEGKKKHKLTTELWRVFNMCWRREPERRISASEILRVLRRLWVMNPFRSVPFVDSLCGTSPQQRSGASYNLEKATAQGQSQPSQEYIDQLDEGGCWPFLTASPD